MKNFITSDIEQVSVIMFHDVNLLHHYRDKLGKMVFEFPYDEARDALSAYYKDNVEGSILKYQSTLKKVKSLLYNK